MLGISLKSFFLISFFIISQQSVVHAKPVSKPGKKSIDIIHTKYAIVPRLTAGFVTGESYDVLEQYDHATNARIVYGGGLTIEYYLSKRWAVGPNFEKVFKDLPGVDVGQIKGTTYSVSGLLNVLPDAKNSPFLRAEIGVTSMKLSASALTGNKDVGLGTHSFFRIGIGLLSYTGSKTNVRIELYNRTFYTDGHEIADFSSFNVAFDASYIGIELAWAIGIFKL